MFRKWSLISLWFASQLQADPTIYVYGHRHKNGLVERSGHSRTTRTSDSGFENMDSWLQSLPALLVDRTSVDPGAGIPSIRVRGHRSNSNLIYIENFKLFDPLYGLQSVPAFDLEALGPIRVDYGTSPPEFPEVTTTGAVSYKLNPLAADTLRTEASYSSLEQQKVSALARKRYGGSAFQIYGRQFKTIGTYLFYNNRGTPDNKEDDRYSKRRNNDRVSDVVMPHLNSEVGKLHLKYFSLLQKDQQGIASVGGLTASKARSVSMTQLHYAALSYANAAGHPEVYIFHRDDSLQTTDTAREFLTLADRSERRSKTVGYGSNFHWNLNGTHAYGNIEKVDSNSRQNELVEIEFARSIIKIYGGLSTSLYGSIDLELKASELHVEDKVDSRTQEMKATNYSLSTSKKISDSKFWFQYGQMSRLPALIEKFGDGRYILANEDLRPERYDHMEIGHAYSAADLQIVTSLYQDHIRDSLLYLPALPNRVKAQNFSQHRISAFETFAYLRLYKFTAEMSYTSFLIDYEGDRIPYVPRELFQFNTTYLHRTHSFALNNRYKGPFTRDQKGTLFSPAQYVSDFIYGKKWFYKDGSFISLQASVLNAFNFTHSHISGKEYAYADLYGHPLPGRYFQLAVKLGY